MKEYNNGKKNINYSFIIPHKNLPDLLERCINSIPERDDIEIIIVDDNSDPEKVDFKNLINTHNDNVKFIINRNGGGAGKARNIGIENSRGKWLLFADSDDTYTNHLNSFLDSHINSDKDIVYFKSNVINTIDSKEKTSNMNLFIDRYISGVGNIDDVKFGAWEPWNKLIKRNIVIENNIRFDEISSSNDKMFSLRLGCVVKRVEVSSEIIYNYILRKGSIIHSAKEKRIQNSFNTILSQNSLYHKQGYKRKVFIPYFLFCNYKYINKQLLEKYLKYLRVNKASPFEGFFNFFIIYLLQRYNSR